MSDTSPLRTSDRKLQLQRLRFFLRIMVPVSFAFGSLYLYAAVTLPSPLLYGPALDTLGFCAAAVVALRLVARGKLEAAAQMAAYALFAMTVVGAYLIPFLLPALVLIPIAGIILVVPFLRGRALRTLLGAGLAVVTATLGLAVYRAPHTPAPPLPLQHFVILSCGGCAAALIMFLLLRDVQRLTHSLEVGERKERESERLLAEEQVLRQRAEEASQLKDQFLATVSHELRTPLTAILGWLHIVRTATLNPERTRRALEAVERNAKAQAQLIEDLLDVSRIISGKLRLQRVPLTLGTVVLAALDSVRPGAAEKGVALELDAGPAEAPAGAFTVMADSERLQQVLWNILANAIKFTPPGGKVRVSVAADAGHAHVSVTDTGEGISPEFLPHVFDAFRQADSTNTRAQGGLGLGLSIVRDLVALHGGTLAARSEGRGHGATFTVSLPLRDLGNVVRLPVSPEGQPEQAPAETPPGLDLQSLRGLQVLVVDDEPDARALLRELLERQGLSVTTAASVQEALAAVDARLPDALISDIGMPLENGYSLIRTLRARTPERGARIPAIALTAYARVEDRLRALDEGFDQHLAKPFEPSELYATLLRLREGVSASDGA